MGLVRGKKIYLFFSHVYKIKSNPSFPDTFFNKMSEVEDGDSAVASQASQNLSAVQPDKVSKYLKRIIPVILEDYDNVELSALESAFSDKNGADGLRKFIMDPQSRALLVSRHLMVGEDDDGEATQSSMANVFFNVSADVHYSR